MARFGLIGPSYASQSPNSDAEVCRNWYPESVESGMGPSNLVLYPTPGLAAFAALPETPVRGIFAFQWRCFAVAGAGLYEVFADGTFTKRATVANDALPAQFAPNATEIMVASGGGAYLMNLSTNAVQRLDTTSGNVLLGAVSMCGAANGYMIALLANSQKIQISAPEDGTTWATQGAPNVDQVNVYPDNVLSMIVDHREIWLFGAKGTVVYSDDAGAGIFDPVPGGYIEQGIVAPYSPVRLDNSVFWIGGDERGAGVAWRANGYQPVRVSNHAVEFAWQSYATVADAWGYSYQDQGHSFWVLRFPTANKTWVYDCATGMWHERSTWNNVQGTDIAHPSCCHAFVFGKHLVGDATSGNVYQMAIPSASAAGEWQFVTDNGQLIRRVRRSPHVTAEKQWIFHQQVQIDVECGLGPQPPLRDGSNNVRDPMIMLRWSDDGGHTWSNPRAAGFGQSGDFTKRVMFRRLGASRDRVYEISCSDPVPCRVVNGYLIADPGFPPQESLESRFRQMT